MRYTPSSTPPAHTAPAPSSPLTFPAVPAARITAPTLVIAGSRAFFYPGPIVRETAERIPQASLRLYDGVGHAVSKTHKRRFEDDVLGFLGS